VIEVTYDQIAAITPYFTFCLAQRSSRFQCAASHSNRERQLRKSYSVAEWTAHEREISVMNILENEEIRPLDDNELAAATGGYRLANETAIKFAATIRKGGDPEDGGE
jgi:hypothetical protein